MSDRPRQLDRNDLGGMNAEQVRAAHQAGQLDDLLHGRPVVGPTTSRRIAGEDARQDDERNQLNHNDLARMSPEDIVAARQRGELDALLGTRTRP